MKKLLCVLFALSVLCMLCACDKTPAETTAQTLEVATAGEELGIPETADFGGSEYNVLSAGNGSVKHNDFDFQESSSLPLDNAQYKRKTTVEEKYGVVVSEDVASAGSNTGNGLGYRAVSVAVNAGDCDYDFVVLGAYDITVLAYSGFLCDLNTVPGIDLSKSWWDKNATENLTLNGVTFFTTGEITTSDNNSAFAILFNKKLLSDYGLENPYTLVENGEWTLDQFAALARAVSEDLDQDNQMTRADRFGLMVWDDSVVGVVNAAGQRCCTIGEDGKLALTISTEQTLSALEKYFAIAFDTEHAFTYQRYISSAADERAMWANDQALFWPTTMANIPALREMESDFGILPYPKLSETQAEYYSPMAPYTSFFVAMLVIQKDIDMAGTVTEALAYYGKEVVTPAYYDVTLVGQSVRDSESSEMLDLIFDTLIYDIGYYYQVGPFNKELIYMIREFDTNFTSRYETLYNKSIAQLETINEAYAQALASYQK